MILGIYNIAKSNFYGDVWSEYTADGTLYPTRKGYEASSNQLESFAHPVFTGIVIRDGGLENLRDGGREQVILCHEKLSLPVFKLVKGKLVKVL